MTDKNIKNLEQLRTDLFRARDVLTSAPYSYHREMELEELLDNSIEGVIKVLNDGGFDSKQREGLILTQKVMNLIIEIHEGSFYNEYYIEGIDKLLQEQNLNETDKKALIIIKARLFLEEKGLRAAAELLQGEKIKWKK
jgi:hypothetical protein